MSAAAFDTYTAAKRLREAGFDEHQAEAAVSMVRDATGADRDALATKADLAEIRADLAGFATKADLAEIRADLAGFATKAELAEILAGFATKADLAEIRADLAGFATKAELAGVRDELRADLHREIGTLRSELRWMLAFQAALILAIAAKLFGIV